MGLWRSWIISAGVALGAALIGGVLMGPLALGFVGLGVVFVAAPVALIAVATGSVYRGPRTNLAGGITVLIIGWLAALVAGAGIGAVAVGIPFNAQSSLSPFLTWFTLLGPFAALGATVAIATHTVSWKRSVRTAR